MPFSFNSTFLIKYLVTVLPLTARFFICRSAKSKSHFSFFILPVFFSKIETISASPLGFAENKVLQTEASLELNHIFYRE